MLLPVRFSEYRLSDFEEIGGKWESIEITKRTKNYTDRLCKLLLNDIEEYTHIRFYKNGLAMIGEPFVDIISGKIIKNQEPQITQKIDDTVYNLKNRTSISPLIKKRHHQQTIYDITGILVWILILFTIFLVFIDKLSIIKGSIGIILLIIHLIAKRKIWHTKIMLIGSIERDYYRTFK